MNHLSEEQLILHYYGEESDAPGAEMHLDQCAECREMYGSLQRVLNPLKDFGAIFRRARRHWKRIHHVEHALQRAV